VEPERLKDLVLPTIEGRGCELWDLTYTGSSVRVFIDTPGGVDLDLCSEVAKDLRPVLDAAGAPISDLDLEVSSPGAERRLRGREDYLRFIGRRVNLRFRRGGVGYGAEGVVEGPLRSVSEEQLGVETAGGETVQVPVGDLVEARLAVEPFGSERSHPGRAQRRSHRPARRGSP